MSHLLFGVFLSIISLLAAWPLLQTLKSLSSFTLYSEILEHLNMALSLMRIIQVILLTISLRVLR